MKMKAWYFLCIFFFFYSLNILIEESYDVAYRLENRTEEYEYLACFDFKRMVYSLRNLKEICLNQLNRDVYNFFDKMKHPMGTRFLEIFNETILVPIRHRECLVFRDMFCFRAKNESKLSAMREFIHLFGNIFAYKNDTFDLSKIKIQTFHHGRLDKLDQLIVLQREYPYSNCIEEYSRFHCLNTCFKGKNRLSKYLYRMDETDGIIQLDYNNNNTALKDDEDECFKECKNNGCKFTYFNKNSNIWKKPKINFFKAHPKMSSYDYWIQLVGIVFFISGLSSYQILSKLIKILNSSVFFNQILSKFIKLIKSKIQIDKLKRRLLNSTKAIIVVIMIFFYYYSCFDLINAFKLKLGEPFKKEISPTLFETEPISLMFCVSLYNISTVDYDNFKEGIYSNKKLLELEKQSDIYFNDTLDGIYLKFQNEQIEVKWTLKPKVLFYEFSRCFLVDVFPSEPKYQSALLITKLAIKFKHEIYDFFLLPYGQSFTSNSYRLDRKFDFIKKIKKSTKECENYNRLNSKLPCISQKECINSCYHQEFIKNYGNISAFSIIDKDHFTKEQWKKLFIYEKFDKGIRTKCEKKIVKKDCLEVKFEKNIKITSTSDHKIITFDLYYDLIMEIEEPPPLHKLLVDILDIQNYFFGLSNFKLLFMIYLLIRNKLKYFLLIIIYIICILGAISKTYFILNEIINEELTKDQHYKLLETLRMPEIVFCFCFDESWIDMNHKLNGNYLNEITKEIRAEFVFDKIRYLDNRTNKWITLKSNFTDDKFRIEEIFFLNEKCLKIILEMQYHRDLFHFSLDSNFDSNVLGISFKKKLIHKMSYFMTKPRDKIQFNKLLKLDRYMFRKTISISQELSELIYYDKFNFIKNPISMFYGENEVNNPAHYLSNLLNNFKRSFNHLRTLNLPLKESHFNDEIDDDLFEQYYLQVQNVTDNYQSTDSNYQRSFATNYYEIINRQKSDFIFNFIFYKKVITVTNRDNHSILIINLLDIFWLWFDLGVLELHAYVHKIKFIFIFTCKLLLEIERFILKFW